MRFLAFLLLLIIVASACEKAECDKPSECSARKCNTVKCNDGKCDYTPTVGCCGNLMCEDDKGESICNCPDDCGKKKCEGMVVLETTKYGPINAKYLQNYCESNKCIVGVPAESVRQIPLLDERQVRSMKVSSVVTIKKPFDAKKDSIKIDFQLKDMGTDIKPPVKFTDIKIISGETLYGTKKISHEMTTSGESWSETIPLSYVPAKIEEEKPISIKIDYEYLQIIDKNNNTKRIADTYENALSERLYMVNPAGVK